MICQPKNLRMKYQALIIQGTIIMLVLTIISIVVLPTSLHQIKIIKISTHDALISSNDAKVTQLSFRIKALIDYAFLQANLTLNKAQQLYLKDSNANYSFKIGIEKQQNNTYLLGYKQPQGQNLTDQNIIQYKKYTNLLSQLEQFLLSFYLEYQSNIQILLRIQNPHIISIFSFLDLPKTFDIESRPYYKEHISQTNTRIIGSPFISTATFKVSLMVSQTIYDEKHNKDAILMIGFQFDNLSKYLTLNNIKFVLCTLNGIIISSNINNTQQIQTFKELTYIYNQTIFPFNKEDWDQMNRYLQNKTYQSNCKQSFIKFCRNIDGNDVQLSAQIILTNFIQITFSDLTFTKVEESIQSRNIHEIFIAVIHYGLAYLFWCLLILLISSVIITRIIRPSSEMITNVELQILTSQLEWSEDTLIEFQYNTNIFCELQTSIIDLLNRHMNYKQKKIKRLNKLNYPRIDYLANLRTKGIQELVNKPISTKTRQNFCKLKDKRNQNNCIISKIDKIIQEF